MTSETDKPKTLDSFLRKSEDAEPTVKPGIRRTEAQQIRSMPNAYMTAVARCAYRRPLDSGDHLCDKKVFYFEDGSSLTFQVTYTAIEDGI